MTCNSLHKRKWCINIIINMCFIPIFSWTFQHSNVPINIFLSPANWESSTLRFLKRLLKITKYKILCHVPFHRSYENFLNTTIKILLALSYSFYKFLQSKLNKTRRLKCFLEKFKTKCSIPTFLSFQTKKWLTNQLI